MVANIGLAPVYDEFVDYLAKMATPEQILAFKVSEVAQKRAEELLDRNNDSELTLEEQIELQQMQHFERMVTLLKAKAAQTLRQS